MMRKISFLLLALLVSCQPEMDCCVSISVGVELSVKDQAGNDLLDPTVSQAIDSDAIRLFYEKDGERRLLYPIQRNAGRGGKVYKSQNEYRLRVSPEIDNSDPYAVTYIQWNERDEDTLRCKIETKGANTRCTRVWFNGRLVWEASSNTERYFEVVKSP